MEDTTVIDGDDLGARVLKIPGETASRHAVDIRQDGRRRMRRGAHRLALLANQRVIRR